MDEDEVLGALLDMGYESDDTGEIVGYDLVGYDEMGQAVLAPRRHPSFRSFLPGRRTPGRAPGRMPVRSLPIRTVPGMPAVRAGAPLRAQVPGAPQPFEGDIPLGLATISFAAAAAAGTELPAVGRPERLFQGERLVATAFNAAGALIPQAISVSLIQVGDSVVNTGPNPLPLTMYAHDATYIRHAFPPAEIGNQVIVRYRLNIIVPAMDTFTVVSAIVGRAVV